MDERKTITAAGASSPVLEPVPRYDTLADRAYEQLKQTEVACQYYNEALMLDEHEPIALFHLARIRAIQGHRETALRYLARLRKVEGAESDACALAKLLGCDEPGFKT